jgi:acetyl esterase/lipase
MNRISKELAAHRIGRRAALAQLSALVVAAVAPRSMSAAAKSSTQYDPSARFELNVFEMDMRRNQAGRMLKARIYEPLGAGPFPAILDLHGGAWNIKNRFAEEPMDRAIAASGALVVAIDLTLASEAPYPACIQDANYGVRWLKSKASQWRGDATKLGVFGSSSGGHVAVLLGMRPADPRYNAIALSAGRGVDATVSYIATRGPITNTLARFENLADQGRGPMVQYNKTFFDPWSAIEEANPQQILERREKVSLPPLLIMQGALDDNIPAQVQEKFARAYRAAGGRCEYRVFEDSVHQWTAAEGPQTDRARATVREFIAQQFPD